MMDISMIDTSLFFYTCGIVAVVMLIWDTIEVGRNDAANIVNAVFGSRVLKRKQAVYLAGLAVIIGAWASSGVIETARKKIFFPETLELTDVLAIYIAVYLTDTVLLYSFSAYGMPVSTTACLVFSLIGGGFMLGGMDSVNWDKSGEVVLAILLSILITGIASFLIQRAFRGAMGQDCRDRDKIILHGPWVAGTLLCGLVYFLLMKGMKDIGFVGTIRDMTIGVYGAFPFVVFLWGLMSMIVYILIVAGGKWVQQNLFAGLAIIGMIAMAIAFGQNDLANCATPGIASWMILHNGELALDMKVPSYLLLFCGLLLALGMTTRNAQRVTRAEVNTGSQADIVRLYAPKWCIALAKLYVPRKEEEVLAPETAITENNRKLQHYDALRAAVITSVSASVIAFASGMKLPISTTYVAFAAVIASGWADRIFMRGDAHIKIARTIWVVTCWFLSALIAAISTGLCSKMISVLGTIGIAIGITINLTTRYVMKRRADRQEEILQKEITERKKALQEKGLSGQDTVFATDTDADEY